MLFIYDLTATWLAQLVDCQSAVQLLSRLSKEYV